MFSANLERFREHGNHPGVIRLQEAADMASEYHRSAMATDAPG